MDLRERIMTAILATGATVSMGCGPLDPEPVQDPVVDEALSCGAPTDPALIRFYDDVDWCDGGDYHPSLFRFCATEGSECLSAQALGSEGALELVREAQRRHHDRWSGSACFASDVEYVDETLCGPIDTTEEGFACCYVAEIRYAHGIVGRPFIVDGEIRHTDAVERGGWMSPMELEHSDGLNPLLRERVAMAWAEDGCHEHASVASFSRFLVQLMWLGAPRDLLDDTTRAIADELRHAHDCFSIASAYAGRTLGPGSVELDGGFDGLEDVEAILVAAITEGCVGETLAAAEAEFKLEYAVEPGARRALEAIAREEGDHATLAWRFVRWLLQERPELEGLARRTFATHAARERAPSVWAQGHTPEHGVVLRHGCLDDAWKERVRSRAYAEIVAPASQVLLGAPRASVA